MDLGSNLFSSLKTVSIAKPLKRFNGPRLVCCHPTESWVLIEKNA